MTDEYRWIFDDYFAAKKQFKRVSAMFDPNTGAVSYFGADWASGCGPAVPPREEGIASERDRIRAALQAMKPSETPFSRGSYELERKAEMRLWEKMMRAVGE